VQEGFPPTLLIHGRADSVVPVTDSERMYEALVARGAEVELHLYAGAEHGFDIAGSLRSEVVTAVARFFDRYVPAENEG
jgi:dipeptidyl aminopeptidase/acylaminoacyl peptidase